MADMESSPRKVERPHTVYPVEVEILGRNVEFSIVHSAHVFANTPEEIGGASALFIEQLSIGSMEAKKEFESVLSSSQYRDVVALATNAANPLPLVIIDATATIGDLLPMGKEAATVVAAGFGGLYLAKRAFVNAKQGLTRRSLLWGAGSLGLLSTPLVGLFSYLADHRENAVSGSIARSLNALNDRSPLNL